jgi:hypothetical protein
MEINMSELVPGTPEYKAIYDKELERLEAEAEKPSTTSEVQAEPEKTEEVKEEPKESPDELKTRLAKVEKALEDTKRWGHQQSAELARIRREREAEKHSATRPEILDQNPGLEDAIKHVAKTPTVSPEITWLEMVSKAIPDAEKLLSNPEFEKSAKERRSELGAEWDDPLVAIRELSELRTQHLTKQSVQGAIEQARKDFESKAKKRTGMEVPGGSGGKSETKSEDEAKKIRDMSSEDFQKMRNRVLGY